MSKKSLVERQKKRDFLCKKFLVSRSALKVDLTKAADLDTKLLAHFKIQNLPRNSSFTRLKNRCLVTGRSRGFYRFFGLSRHVLREMALAGNFPGVVKSSW
uniref:Small ribosomal subunit protein uS14c n=1 Tax=Phacus orbicularis TaxID=158829 RepID=A0A172F1Z0_9EUGL|nr:ribosomal protein S14 [Phacus orbicularis]